MSDAPVISVENVSKAYSIYAKPMDMVWEVLTGKPRHDVFWALKDVSFTVKEKQRVGIIGPNGAGKSTLLKMITGHLPPTAGRIQVNGRISAMLTLASSLNPEETGLSNIRFNLILNGSPHTDLDRLVEEIVEFTELGPFIYSPVKTYSSGMLARLSFAIATAIEPEVLVVDEVLGAGDGYFIGKATRRMLDLCNRGKALLFVSHSTGAVRMLCDTVIWVDNGGVRVMGPVDYVTKLYEEDYLQREAAAARDQDRLRKQNEQTDVHLSELGEVDTHLYRVRLTAPGHKFTDTHYVRRVRVAGEGLAEQDVPLGMVDIRQKAVAAGLELLRSEWGRLYCRQGHECRILTAQTNRAGGGQMVLKRPAGAADPWRVDLYVEASALGREPLDIEFANYQTGAWQKAPHVQRTLLPEGWYALATTVAIPAVAPEQYQRTVEAIAEKSRPDIEIQDVQVWTAGQPAQVLFERQAFQVRVAILAHRRVPCADVSIKISRSDGVYVFWQSSGLEGENLREVEGAVTAWFDFTPNCLAQGEYQITAAANNGWDLAHNYPYTQAFDCRVNACKFVIKPEFAILDFGQVNMRVPVRYEYAPRSAVLDAAAGSVGR